MSADITVCPHCQQKLERFRTPGESSWGEVMWLVCYNDECSYFLEGWDHMRSNFKVNCSYRFRYDPEMHTSGPMVVYSADMGRDHIVSDEASEAGQSPTP